MSPSFHNTCAIIVAYCPDAHFPDRLEKVVAQFSLTIIVDNASSDPSAKMLRILSATPNVVLLTNTSNLGIAAALNQGLMLALERDFEWGLTLDQDTLVYPDLRDTLSTIYVNNDMGDIIAGGNYWNVHRRKNFISCSPGKAAVERTTLITSGTLLSIALVKRIGGFREDYFIDSVDHEFCLRARAHGCRILMCCKPVMSQSIGVAKEQNGWISGLASFNHSPFRKYFIARNATATIKSYFFREPAWAVRQVCRLVFDFASILLLEHDKGKKVQAFLVGLAHGVIGKMGAIESAWPNGSR